MKRVVFYLGVLAFMSLLGQNSATCFVVLKGKKWGIKNEAKTKVVERADSLFKVSDKLFAAKFNEELLLLDAKGNKVLETKFSLISNEFHDKLLVRDFNGYNIYDISKDRLVFEKSLPGFLVWNRGDLYGYQRDSGVELVNSNGEKIVNQIFNSVKFTDENYILTTRRDIEGDSIFSEIYDYKANLVFSTKKGQVWDQLDDKFVFCSLILDSQLNKQHIPILDTLYEGSYKEECYLLDSSFLKKMQINADILRYKSKGAIMASKYNMWGYIDNKGNWLVTPKYASLELFNNYNMAIYTDQEYTGCINTQGVELARLKLDSSIQLIDCFNGGLIEYDVLRNKYRIVDYKNNRITTKEYEFISFYDDRYLQLYSVRKKIEYFDTFRMKIIN